MVEYAIGKYPGQETTVNNLSSGIFCTMNGLGEVVGPLFGAQLHERFGFRMTSDLTSVVAFFYVLIFFIISSRSPIKREATGDEAEGEDLKNELLSGSGTQVDLQKFKSVKSSGSKMHDELYSTLTSSNTSTQGSPSLSETSRLRSKKSPKFTERYSSTVSSNYSIGSKHY